MSKDIHRSHERHKQVLQQSNLNAKAIAHHVSSEKTRILNDIKDILVIRKIQEKGARLEELKETFEENETDILKLLEEAERHEQEQLAKEQEFIVKKQLQVLQADERGKRALLSEIAEIKKKQEKRAEALKVRWHALEVEKERAKRIASLPPPLPPSLKSLLKKNAEKETESPSHQADLNFVLQNEWKEPASSSLENKENIIDPNEIEASRKKQEERDMKAKKRFNEALKKDRKKQECAEILKDIENAERLNRRQMAKNISSDIGKKVPCNFSDKLYSAERQTKMEDAVENLCMKSKEHAIEDVEGYEDMWEAKYKKYDSDFEAKMIDCVPNFVRENYEYLLEDESKFQSGKKFSVIEESSSDVFNEAYISSPPQNYEDPTESTENIDAVINQLEIMRTELKTTYEETLKPLLEAELAVPKKELTDKAVETDAIKVTAEDKAVETDIIQDAYTFPPQPMNIMNAGVLNFKQRDRGSIFDSYKDFDLHVPQVTKSVPRVDLDPVRLDTASWSSSSYHSLPSKHGMPNVSDPCDSRVCDICIAEKQNVSVESKVPEQISLKINKTDAFKQPKKVIETSENISHPKKNSLLSSYIQKVAEKYLEKKPVSSPSPPKQSFGKPTHVSTVTSQDKSENLSTDIENKIKSSDKSSIVNVPQSSKQILEKGEKSEDVSKTYGITKPSFHKNISMGKGELQRKESELNNEHLSDFCTSECLDDSENQRLQLIHQIVFRPFFRKNDERSLDFDSPKIKPQIFQEECEVVPKSHMYHELSTILEMDSALTGGTPPGSFSETAIAGRSQEKEEVSDLRKQSTEEEKLDERLDTVSLINIPYSEVSDLVKNIHFVPEISDESHQPTEIKVISSNNLNLQNQSPSEASPSTKSTIEFKGSSGKIDGTTDSQKYLTAVSLTKTPVKSELKFNICDSVSSSSSDKIETIFDSAKYDTSASSTKPSVKSRLKFDTLDSVSSQSPISEQFTGHSSTSCLSQGTPISSSLIKSHEKYPYLKDTAILPRYFKDVSSIQREIYNPRNQQNMPDSKKLPTNAPNQQHVESSFESFKPMTPQSDFYSTDVTIPSNSKFEKERHKLGKDHEKHDIPAIGFRSPVPYILPSSSQIDSNGSFKPMTPCSFRNFELHQTNLHQNISPLTSIGSFKPLTPDSNISSPSGSGSYYNNSSLSSSSLNTFEKNRKFSTSSSGTFRPMTFRFDISSPKSAGSYKNSKCHVTETSSLKLPPIRFQISVRTDSQLHTKSAEQEDITLASEKLFPNFCLPGKDLVAHLDSKTKNQAKLHTPSEPRILVNEAAHPCGSDFFIPHINTIDLLKPDHAKDNEAISMHSLKNRKATDATLGMPAEYNLVESSLIEGYQEMEKKFLKNTSLSIVANQGQDKNFNQDSSAFLQNINKLQSNKNVSVTPDSKGEPSNTANVGIEKAVVPLINLAKQKSSKLDTDFQGATSSSSSTENLSEMFTGSKITFQSTPMKSWEEIMQEPGIMEEPDLTLVPTGFITQLESPEKPRSYSVTTSMKSAAGLLRENDTMIMPFHEIGSLTPSTDSQNKYLCTDSPSMISFLQHESSCLNEHNAAASSAETVQGIPEKLDFSQLQEIRLTSAQKNPGNDYKKRTVRLWNNLEEVKKKNLAEERRKRMAMNRLKVKEFSKKLVTPKKKGK